jgi:hypothetical protein
MSNPSKDDFKEAIDEWLDKKFAQFGKWSITGILAAVCVWVFYGWLNFQGWHK